MADATELFLKARKELQELREHVDGELTGLRNQDDATIDAVGRLKAELDAFTADVNAVRFAKSPWWWPRLTREEAQKAWAKLLPWVDAVLVRYDRHTPATGDLDLPTPVTMSKVQRCWFAHPPIVDAFAALYWQWVGAYKTGAQWRAPTDWQKTDRDAILKLASHEHELGDQRCYNGCPLLTDESGQPRKVVTLEVRRGFVKAEIASHPEAHDDESDD